MAEAQTKLKEIEYEIENYNPEENYTSLEDYQEYAEYYRVVIKDAEESKQEALDYAKAVRLEIEEYNKVLTVYYAVLN